MRGERKGEGGSKGGREREKERERDREETDERREEGRGRKQGREREKGGLEVYRHMNTNQNIYSLIQIYLSIHTSPKALGVTVLTHSRAIVLEYSTVAWRQDHISAPGHTPALVHKVPTAITLGVIGTPARGVGGTLGVAHKASCNCDGGKVGVRWCDGGKVGVRW